MERSTTLSALDTYLMKHLFGDSKEAAELQREASAIHKMKRIRNTPILVLKAYNDPLIGKEGIDEQKLLENKNVILATTKYGGHLGYYSSFRD